MLFSCWQKDTTTRPYRPYRAVLLFSNTKRRVILRMRSDAFQSACDAASTKNKRMATQTNAVKSLSDEVDFSLSGSKCTVSARFQNVQRVLFVAKSDKGCRNYRVKNHVALIKNNDDSKLPEIETNRRLALLISGPRVRVPGGAPQQQNPNFFPIGEGFWFFVFFGKQNESLASIEKRPRPYHKKARQTTVRVP